MTQRTCGWALRASSLGCLTIVLLSGGCAPTRFDEAIAYYAEKTAVTDAAARHTTASPYYRFNAALLSDLDDALEPVDEPARREKVIAVLRGANALARASNANEIERMPADARKALAAIAGISADTAVLQEHFAELASAALESDLGDVDRLPASELRKKLRAIRKGIEDLPDDRGRAGRRAMLFWGIVPVAMGIEKEESLLAEKCLYKVKKTFDRIAIWRPNQTDGDTLIARYAPIIGVEWPANRRYDANSDRIGAVKLSANRDRIEVHIDPAEPAVYAHTSQAKVNGRVYQQLNYVWWFPERPAMTVRDLGAGHIDGSMIRITLDSDGQPIFVESSLNCGCAHEVFVSGGVESAARNAFGAPLDGKRFAVEKSVSGKHDVVVIDTFDVGPNASHPLVLSSAGYHDVYQIKFNASETIDSTEIAEEASYRVLDYATLDRLPLGAGVASMFGPDGLVHNAGRPEGYLLAPSGMLSAAQPRKRGTQRIRWDDHLHDDPHLLEKTLRVPALD